MKAYALYWIVCAVAVSARAQGTFRNVDFESANVDQLQPPGLVNTVDAIPGWNAYLGGVLQSRIYFNMPSLGVARISLIGTQDQLGRPIEGGFGIALQGGVTPLPTGDVLNDAAISQTGRLPSDALSVLFKAQAGLGALTVSVNDVSLPVIDLGSEPNYSLYGVDISAFSGQLVTLKLSAVPITIGGPNYWNLDSIVLSPTAIPEPNVLSLTAVGILLVGLFGRSRWAVSGSHSHMTSLSQRLNPSAATKPATAAGSHTESQTRRFVDQNR